MRVGTLLHFEQSGADRGGTILRFPPERQTTDPMIELHRARVPHVSSGREGSGSVSSPPPAPSLPPALFRAFRELAAEQCGIRLRDGKEALVATRIAGR